MVFLSTHHRRGERKEIRNHNLHRIILLFALCRISSSYTLPHLTMSSISPNPPSSIDDALTSRFACTRFRPSLKPTPEILSLTQKSLEISLRSPTSFNAQPYRAVLVSSPEAKTKLAKYMLGRNADRVLDSDCTVVFLSDNECGRDWKRWNDNLKKTMPGKSKWAVRKVMALMLMFSSGYPLPKIIRSPVSFGVRTVFSTLSFVTRRKLLLPSLTNAENWSTKNTMLFVMSYMLACTSRGLATCPMEGYNVGGVRKALGIPRRFGIPVMVSTGVPYGEGGEDDAGLSHGKKGGTKRYDLEEVVFGNVFGRGLEGNTTTDLS